MESTTQTYVVQVKVTSSQLVTQIWVSGKGVRWLADEVFYKWLIFNVMDWMRSPGKSVYIFKRQSSIMFLGIPIFR